MLPRREFTPPLRRPNNPRPPPCQRSAQAERVAPPERAARAPRLVQAEESLSTRLNNATKMNLPPNVDVRAANVPHVAPPALNGANIVAIVLQATEARKVVLKYLSQNAKLVSRSFGENIGKIVEDVTNVVNHDILRQIFLS
ncbi:hypothetical protein ACFE04_021094 [Oxalis oulophora]